SEDRDLGRHPPELVRLLRPVVCLERYRDRLAEVGLLPVLSLSLVREVVQRLEVRSVLAHQRAVLQPENLSGGAIRDGRLESGQIVRKREELDVEGDVGVSLL